jgi:hypothetical protein
VETVNERCPLRDAQRHGTIQVFTSRARRTRHVQPILHICSVITNSMAYYREQAKSEGTPINLLTISASPIQVTEGQIGYMPEAEVGEYGTYHFSRVRYVPSLTHPSATSPFPFVISIVPFASGTRGAGSFSQLHIDDSCTACASQGGKLSTSRKAYMNISEAV